MILKSRYLLILILSFFVEGSCHLQTIYNRGAKDIPIEEFLEDKLMGKLYLYQKNYNDAFFISSKWENGDILLYNNKWLRNRKFKYNNYLDELICLNDNNYLSVIIDKTIVKEFKIRYNSEDSVFHFKKVNYYISNGDNDTEHYFQILSEGLHATLYSFRKAEMSKNQSGQQKREIVSFRTKNIYFIEKNADKQYHKLTPNRRKLIKILEAKDTEFHSMLRKSNLRLKRENELKEAIELYNKWCKQIIADK